MAERVAVRALRGHQRDMYPTNHFTDFTKKYVHELLETPNLQIPPTGQWVPPMLYMSQLDTPPPYGWLLVNAPPLRQGEWGFAESQ